MDGGSADKFHTLVPSSESRHWTWATCSLYQKPVSPHIGLFGGWEGLSWSEMATLFPGLFTELFYLHQDGNALERVPGPQEGAWVFCSKGAFVFRASFPLRVGLVVGLSGRLVQGHSEDSALGFPGRLYPTGIGFGPFSWLSRIITTDTQGAEEESIWLLQLHV